MNKTRLAGFGDEIKQAVIRRIDLLTSIQEMEDKKDILANTLAAHEEAQVFIQTVAKEMQEELRFRMEDIVNTALDAVFPNKYQFKMTLQIARNKTEIVLSIVDSDNPSYELDPMMSNGGGLSDILAFALRIAVLLISKKRKILILDEALKFVSNDMKGEAFAIMKVLSDKFSIQVIGVTHDADMVRNADMVFAVSQIKKISQVRAKG